MAGESGHGIVSDAPSRREVASAFEMWREESHPAPAEVEGPEPLESGDGFAARAVFDEPSPREDAEGAGVEGAGAAGAEVSGAEVSGAAGADAGTTGRAGSESKRRRAGGVVKENIMPRVERMRDEALVVLEETPDDAGLRFVAAAVVLFLLFLLILFLSTVLK